MKGLVYIGTVTMNERRVKYIVITSEAGLISPLKAAYAELEFSISEACLNGTSHFGYQKFGL